MSQPVPRVARRRIILCLVVFGGLLLFCAGIVLGRRQTATDEPEKRAPRIARTSTKPRVRNVFSPSVIGDPYVLDEQRKVVEALERSCKLQHQNCETARNARGYLDSHSETR